MKIEPKDYLLKPGFARKRKRTIINLNLEQKDFLIKLFEQGEKETSQKVTPFLALKSMREKMEVDERITQNQIKEFFKTLIRKKKKQTLESIQTAKQNQQPSTKTKNQEKNQKKPRNYRNRRNLKKEKKKRKKKKKDQRKRKRK